MDYRLCLAQGRARNYLNEAVPCTTLTLLNGIYDRAAANVSCFPVGALTTGVKSLQPRNSHNRIA